jgi:hypothetical protein
MLCESRGVLCLALCVFTLPLPWIVTLSGNSYLFKKLTFSFIRLHITQAKETTWRALLTALHSASFLGSSWITCRTCAVWIYTNIHAIDQRTNKLLLCFYNAPLLSIAKFITCICYVIYQWLHFRVSHYWVKACMLLLRFVRRNGYVGLIKVKLSLCLTN